MDIYRFAPFEKLIPRSSAMFHASKFLFLIVATAFAQAQTVTIYSSSPVYPSQPYNGLWMPSHGSVSVEFSYVGPTPTDMRAHASVGTCSDGVIHPGDIAVVQGVAGDILNKKRFPFQPSDDYSGPTFDRATFAGLTPDTTYSLCPEGSIDGGNHWSTGASIVFHTPPLPSVHPAVPIAPKEFDTSYPDMTGADVERHSISGNSPCQDLTAAINTSITNQMIHPSLIMIDPTVVCDNFYFLFPKAQDMITFDSANVNLTNNTIGSPVYPPGVPPVTEGMGIKFARYQAYHGDFPAFLKQPNKGNGASLGKIFYVHFPNASDTNNFQIFYPQPYAACSSCLYALGDAGSGSSAGFVEWPRPLKQIVIRTAAADNQFAPEHVRITPNWANQMPLFRNGHVLAQDNLADSNYKVALGNIRFTGLRFSFDGPLVYPDLGPTPDPPTFGCRISGCFPAIPKTLYSSLSDGPITFDRVWIHGPDLPDRIDGLGDLDGSNIAVVDSRIDQMYAWQATSTWFSLDNNLAVNLSASGNTFTIGPGQWHGGAFNYVQSGTMSVTTSGTP